eukprot:s1307_g11.t1
MMANRPQTIDASRPLAVRKEAGKAEHIARPFLRGGHPGSGEAKGDVLACHGSVSLYCWSCYRRFAMGIAGLYRLSFAW